MVCAEDGPIVLHMLPHCRKRIHEQAEGNIAQDIPVEACGYGTHFLGNRGIVGGQVGVVSTGIDNQQVVAQLPEIAGNGGNGRMLGVGEIYADHATLSASDLVHESRRFSEIIVLGEFAQDSQIDRFEDIPVVQVVEQCRDQHLDCSG
jgi:hypothetical protein